MPVSWKRRSTTRGGPPGHRGSATGRTLAIGLWLVLCHFLLACSEPGLHSALLQYNERLQRPLDVVAAQDIAAALNNTANTLHAMPRSAALQLPLAGDSLDALDFLALRGCALQTTVAKRNTSLGRLAAPSQRLLLELEFLQLAPACIEQLRAEARTALADTLQDVMANKVEQLPARIYNATLASEEFRDLWRPPPQLGDYPQQTSSAPIVALEAIAAQAQRWLEGDYTADGATFELQLSEVARGDAGDLLLALGVQQTGLEAAALLMAARAEQGPLCRPGFLDREAEILRAVIRRFFIEGVQPWSAGLERRRHGLLPPILSLEETLAEVLPEAYRLWLDWRSQQLEQGAAAPAAHVAEIQSMLDGCAGSL